MSDSSTVKLTTNLGTITIELDRENAPQTVENFLAYVNSKHYDDTIFHRVIPGFMIQGGGFDADMEQADTGEPIENEADNGLKNEAGTIAMARTMDPHSASAQFFINCVDNEFLNHTGKTTQGWGYAVFGRVTDGMDVVQKIEQVATSSHGMHQDVPREAVTITSAEVV